MVQAIHKHNCNAWAENFISSFTSKYVAVIVARLQDGQQINSGSIPNRGKMYLSHPHQPENLSATQPHV
jgi:hypothetical protein